jgi:hypothetical protein
MPPAHCRAGGEQCGEQRAQNQFLRGFHLKAPFTWIQEMWTQNDPRAGAWAGGRGKDLRGRERAGCPEGRTRDAPYLVGTPEIRERVAEMKSPRYAPGKPQAYL